MVPPLEFSAQAFHPGLPKGQAGASCGLASDHLRCFVCEQCITLPLLGLQLKLGGASDRLLFFSHPDVPDWQFYTSDLRVLHAPALIAHPAAGAVREANRRHKLTFLGALAAILAAFIFGALLIYWSLDGLSGVVARRLPASWEQKLGESVIAQYRLEHEFLAGSTAQPLLQPLTQPLLAALGETRYPMKFHLVDDPALNAFALPGGTIVINTGLVLSAQRADELQGVIAHEISHVTEQHGIRTVMRSAGVFVVVQALVGDASGLLAVLANAGPVLANQAYSRDFEREADDLGYTLLRKARIDPRGMADFFRLVLAEEKKQIEKIEDERSRELFKKTKGFLSTHPETEARITDIETRLKADAGSHWRNDQAAFLALKQAVQAFVSQQEGNTKQ
jgi:Zn-dependent protease with chaperone function